MKGQFSMYWMHTRFHCRGLIYNWCVKRVVRYAWTMPLAKCRDTVMKNQPAMSVASVLAESQRRGVRQQFLIATHRNSASRYNPTCALILTASLFRFATRFRIREPTRKSRIFHASVERGEKPWGKSLTIDVASTRLMNESIGQTRTRGLEAYRCFQFFGLFSRLPTYFVTRQRL